jgi:hypothetical protein
MRQTSRAGAGIAAAKHAAGARWCLRHYARQDGIARGGEEYPSSDRWVKTMGDIVTHLLTTHFAFHIGQISAWRRLEGQSFLI